MSETNTSQIDPLQADRLRLEVAQATDRDRQARLLCEIAEREVDEPIAVRDYLAAFNADPTFREPLEALVRLLERRRSLKNLGRVIDALVRAAVTPAEKTRALVMRAAFLEDVQADIDGAKAAAREATQVEGEGGEPPLPLTEASTAWLTLELLGARLNDLALREEALEERAKRAADTTWKALLELDAGRLAVARGDIDRGLELFGQARASGGAATFTAALSAERLVKREPGIPGSDEATKRSAAYADALEAQATMIADAIGSPEKGDALGVPLWTRNAAHVADAWLRAADVRLLLGDTALAATTLDRALAAFSGEHPLAADPLAIAALLNARIRVAERMGNTELAASLAEKRLETETDAGVMASLQMRLAEHAASQGDVPRALAAVAAAVQKEPTAAPARALQLDILADSGDPATFAGQLEGFAEALSTDDARARTFLLAATIWALRAGDAASAKAALSQATMSGVDPIVAARLGRSLANATNNPAWHDEATRRLLASESGDDARSELWFELLRGRLARDDAEGAKKALGELARLESGWLGRVIEAFLPAMHGETPEAQAERSSVALDELTKLESDPQRQASLALMSAVRASRARGEGENKLAWPDGARSKLRAVLERTPDDVLVGTAVAEVERIAGDDVAAAIAAETLAVATDDAEFAASLRLEAGLARWRAGDRRAALEAFEAAAAAAPKATNVILGWAARGVDPDSLEGRRRAIARAAEGGGDASVLALERFALEAFGGDATDAEAALEVLDEAMGGEFATAGALARLIWTEGASSPEAIDRATAHLASIGAASLAGAERHRVAVAAGDAEGITAAARAWFDAGGGLTAGIEWLAGTVAAGDEPREVARALHSIASALDGEPRESLEVASALLSITTLGEQDAVPFVSGDSVAVLLANLELAAPGSDPRRRATALCNVGDALGTDSQADAMALGAWSLLAAGDVAGASEAFRAVCGVRPDDLGSWEGLRTAAAAASDAHAQATAAQELGPRCSDAARGAAFYEEAAGLWLAQGDADTAEICYSAAFDRDPTRAHAFDKLFRRVRERKDGPRLLTIIERRLQHTDDPPEVAKLFWEQARALREKGDNDGALLALENVTMIEPDHVGALALSGEIFIRRGMFAEAAEKLGTLAKLDGAPAKSRLTAGVAAVDLFENKLEQPAKGLEILLALHTGGLSTLPVRERLAKSAARNQSWEEATSILEELMREREDSNGRVEAARLAMVIHRDRIGDKPRAANAITKLLEEAPAAAAALDMLLEIEAPTKRAMLERAKAIVLSDATRNPADTASVLRLAKLAQALKEPILEEAALAVGRALGGPNPSVEQALARFAARRARVVPQVRITPQHLGLIMAPQDSGPIADLFVALGPTLTEALGPSLEVLGVSKRDRVDAKSGLPLRNELVAWAGAFGIEELEVFIGGRDPQGVQGVPGEIPALIVGPNVTLPLTALSRARLARELFGLIRGTTILRSRDETTVAAIVVAACKLAEVRLEAPPYAVQAEIDKQLGKAIARKTKKLLSDACNKIAQTRADAKTWTRAAAMSHARASLVAAGELGVVLADMLPPASPEDPRAADLARFVLSPAYADVRRSLGLDGGT